MAKKLGMTQLFTQEGACQAVTVMEVEPATITQIKIQEKDGYTALQLGSGSAEFSRLTKAEQGHLKKKDLKAFRRLKEFRVPSVDGFKLGQVLEVNLFEAGDLVDVSGQSKGKGFQGVIKRHHKGGGPASHGSHFHRSTGSIGQRTWPGHVFKNMKLPGHMGDRRVTVQGLKVLQVLPEQNRLVLQGAVPGSRGSYLEIKLLDAGAFIKRAEKLSGGDKKEVKEAGSEKKDENAGEEKAA